MDKFLEKMKKKSYNQIQTKLNNKADLFMFGLA